MKKFGAFIQMLCLIAVTLPAGAQVLEIHSFINLNKAVPDGNAAGMSDVQTFSSPITSLTAVKVKLKLAGQFNGDLYGYVRHIISGKTNFCVLLNRVGRSDTNAVGYADSGFDVTLDGGASNGDIHIYRNVTTPAAGAPLTNSWQPDGRNVDPAVVVTTNARNTTLSSFNTFGGWGEWTLFLADLESGGTNMLVSWELQLNGVATPTVTWATPANITYGTALSGTQLNASSSVAGAFVYTPASGAMLNVGSNQTLSVTFTPTDTSSYTSVTMNVTINVQKAPLTITANSTNKVYGAAVPDLGASYSGFVNSDTTNKLTTRASLSTAATAASAVRSYTITASGASSSNYTIAYVSGTLTVTKASTTGIVSSSVNPSLPSQLVTFTMALSAVAPGAGTPGGSVQFKIDGANAGSAAALSGGAATYSISTLTLGTHTVSAEYAGDGNFFGATNSLSPVQLVNTPPVAGADTIYRWPTNGTKVAIAALLTNDSDADGDAVSFVSASATSANGGALTVSNGWVFYTPAAGFTNTDTFTYTISDGRGAPVTGTVTVAIKVDTVPSPDLVVTSLGGGSYQLRFDGIPGRTYHIQYTEDLAVWLPLGTGTADGAGLFVLIDTPPGGAPQRFYRAVYP